MSEKSSKVKHAPGACEGLLRSIHVKADTGEGLTEPSDDHLSHLFNRSTVNIDDDVIALPFLLIHVHKVVEGVIIAESDGRQIAAPLARLDLIAARNIGG